MNTKIIYAIIILLVLAGGIFAAVRLNKTSEPKNSEVASNQQNNSDSNQSTKDKGAPVDQANNDQCVRNFSADTLKTAKVDIANRTATLTVKGFGDITVEFYDKDAPKTVENFLRLANAGYFDCLTFHRVAKGFVIQGGDPTGTGSGGESAFGKEFADELNPATASYKAGYKHGVLAMANRGPNTNTSQFFIMLGDVSLPNSYTIFGKVSAGLDIVDKIGQVEITPQLGATDGRPVTPVVITKVTLGKK